MVDVGALLATIRDSEPGQNTIVGLENLLDLGLDVVVLGPDVPSPVPYNRWEPYEYGVIEHKRLLFRAIHIDRKWVADQNLLEGAGDDELTSAIETARSVLQEVSDRYRSRSFADDSEDRAAHFGTYMREHQNAEDAVKSAEAEFVLYRPLVLTETLKDADLIVSPPDLVEKILEAVPAANIAVYVSNGESFSLCEEPAGENRMRVLIPDHTEETSRIDHTTLDLLFNPWEPGEDRYDMFSEKGIMSLLSGEGHHGKFLHQSFYFGLQMSKVQSSPRKGIPNRSLLPDTEGSNAISNFFHLGGHQRSSRTRGHDYLQSLKEDKAKSVRRAFELLWTTPLDSIEQVVDRQTIYAELIANSVHQTRLRGLEQSINQLLEPHLHLSSMARLLGTNILGSKWGAAIRRKNFYDDFMAIAPEFIKAYESLVEHLDINSDSQELRTLLAPIRMLVESDNYSSLRSTYTFLNKVMTYAPKDFRGLADIFWSELRFKSAHTIPEMEELESEYDTSRMEPGWHEKRLGRTWSEKRAELFGRFYDQIPIANSEAAIDYLDAVSTKLTAFIGMADYFRKFKWVRPEIMPAEEAVLDIRNGFYPLLPDKDPIPNDTLLDSENAIEIIEGTNHGGKTVDLKKAMFIVAAALSGNFVPAEHARVSFFHRVRYRVKDTGMYNTGALSSDLSKMASAIEALGVPIFVGLDETFTSTNSREGEALTHALITRLLQDEKARAIFTSHYPTLQDLESTPGIKFSHFEYEQQDGDIAFTHRKKEGPNLAGDYALAIAESQGIHPRVLAYAREHQLRTE